MCRQEKIIYLFNKEITNEWDDFTYLCYNYLNKTEDFNFKKSLEVCKKINDNNKDTKYYFIYDEKSKLIKSWQKIALNLHNLVFLKITVKIITQRNFF